MEPGILHARAKAGASMKEIDGGEGGVGGTEGSELGGGTSESDKVVDTGVAGGVRKNIWLETQSIDGLWRASQSYPSTAEA